jgi:LuxR family transcriptional regulator, maltose regulon positive regulatory protein
MAQRIPHVADGLLHAHETHGVAFVVNSPAWFAWLEDPATRSFSFEGPSGRLTARRERRTGSSEGYWTAYRKMGGKLRKVYLGKAANVTLGRLDYAAELLTGSDGEAEAPPPLAAAAATAAGGPSPAETAAQGPPLVDSPSPGGSPPGAGGDPLLLTKLSVRSARPSQLPRRSLCQRIDQGVQQKLTLISAPAGFGKSTLLSTWISTSSTEGRLVAWLSVDARDNDPARFWRYFIHALSRHKPGLGQTALALLGSPQAPAIPTILTTLINDLDAQSVDVVLVLDDYHLIESREIHEGMSFLLDNLPPRVHLIIATRADPPLMLSRLRARGELLELRATDLRFSVDEAGTFINQVMGLPLAARDVSELVGRTEGWAVGLQMAALAMRDHADVAGFISAFTGSNRFVMDYLAQEVLARRPPAVRAFLLKTSVLDRMCASLCESVTSTADSQEMLEGLERANLFVDPLDEVRGWYRYHHLFADVLRQRLGHEQPEIIPDLQRKASEWFERQGLVVDAIQHALRGRDPARSVRLIEAVGLSLVLNQQIQTVLGWLEELPPALVRERPSLHTIRALALVFSDRPAAAEASLQDAEQSLSRDPTTEEARALMGRVAVIRAAIARVSGDLERSVALLREAVELLPETDATSAERASARAQVTFTYLVSGDVNPDHERPFEEAIAAIAASGTLMPLLNSINRLGRFQTLQGRLRTACATYQRAADVVSGRAEQPGAMNSSAHYVGLGDIHRQWNDLDAAERYLRQAVDLVTGGVTVDAHVVTDGYLSLARVQLARGWPTEARATLDEFTDLARQRRFFSLLVERGTAEQARLALKQGDLAAATLWADATDLGETAPRYPLEDQHLTLARVLIAQGRGHATGSLITALALLDRLLAAAENAGRINSVIEILTLRALTLQAQREPHAAVAALERALAIAEPEGYVRVFVDEEAPMAALLTEFLAARRTGPRDAPAGAVLGYARMLRAAFEAPDTCAGTPDRSAPEVHQLLVTSLTRREQEVLELIAAGLSNQAIAERLFVATSTVKSYINSIFRRLGVTSRTQAVAAARALHLISG